jgi:hypothetical protein
MDLGPSKFMPCILLKSKPQSLSITDFATTLKFTDSIQRSNWYVTVKFKFMEPEYVILFNYFVTFYDPTSVFPILNGTPLPHIFLSEVVIQFPPTDIQTVHVGLPSVLLVHSKSSCFCFSYTNFSPLVQQRKASVTYSLRS